MNEEKSVKLSPSQIGAIRRSLELALTLQKEHPEIRELYKEGKYRSDIIKYLGLCYKYRITEEVAKTAISIALRGHNGSFEIDFFEGLLSKEESSRLSFEHRSENGRDYIKLYGKGIGEDAYKLGRGIHALNSKEKANALRLATIARGQVPWKEREITDEYCVYSEKEYILMSCRYPKNIYQNGPNKGLSNFKNVADDVNRKYHNGVSIRTPNSVKVVVKKLKAQGKPKTQ